MKKKALQSQRGNMKCPGSEEWKQRFMQKAGALRSVCRVACSPTALLAVLWPEASAGERICYDPYAMTCDDFLYVFRKSSHLHETHLEEF